MISDLNEMRQESEQKFSKLKHELNDKFEQKRKLVDEHEDVKRLLDDMKHLKLLNGVKELDIENIVRENKNQTEQFRKKKRRRKHENLNAKNVITNLQNMKS